MVGNDKIQKWAGFYWHNICIKFHEMSVGSEIIKGTGTWTRWNHKPDVSFTKYEMQGTH
jgi:hypothetical protein